MRVLIAGYQHETNTFAPSLADWTAFTRGDSFPAFVRGAGDGRSAAAASTSRWPAVIDAARSARLAAGAAAAGPARSRRRTSRATRSSASPVRSATTSARAQRGGAGLDAVYLDLHGAAVAEHADDSEGELLARVRAIDRAAAADRGEPGPARQRHAAHAARGRCAGELPHLSARRHGRHRRARGRVAARGGCGSGARRRSMRAACRS